MKSIASHGAADDPSRALRRADAPKDLRAWVSGRSIDELWEQCDRGDWLIWLAVVDRVPLVAMVEAGAACAERAAEAMPKGRKRLLRAIAAARALESPDACDEQAALCEAKADDPEAASYRSAPPSQYRWAAHAAALAARSAEGLLRAEVVRQGDRLHDARERAASVGAGDQVMAGPDPQPLVFDIDDEWSQFTVDAAASAVNAAVRSLLPVQPNDAGIERVEAELSELVFEILDPVRTAIVDGSDPREVVGLVHVRPFAELDERGMETLAVDKKPYLAVLAGGLIPIGGGHYYADHRELGHVLSAGIIGGAVLGAWVHVPFAYGSLLLIAFDVLLAARAVRKRNEGKLPSKGQQIAQGVIAALLAFAIALAVWS